MTWAGSLVWSMGPARVGRPGGHRVGGRVRNERGHRACSMLACVPTGAPGQRGAARGRLGMGIKGGPVGGGRRYPQLGDASWLRRRYVDDGASVRMIAAEVGCGDAAVRRALT